MGKIKVMSETLANKIAAGEIVERVSSIVKELTENSIDASSTIITVELEDAGKKSIRIIDNGVGMSREDAECSFLRHATSKLYKDDDLFFINTLGFRGEALPSIASVSEMTLDTCDGETSTHIHIKGGILLETSDTSMRKGTIISVTNLFYNTPARLKFLKSENSELNSVISYLEKLALSVPSISINLLNNQNQIIKTSGSGDLLKTIHEIYGSSISANMMEIKGISDDFEISGYISKPQVLRSTKNHMTTFINGRVIKNFEINKIIDEAYHTYKPDNLYPIVVINIDTDPTLVDVNIHPTKQDVKLSKMDDLKNVLTSAIKDALYRENLIPSEENKTIVGLLPKTLLQEEPYQEYTFNTFERDETNEVKTNVELTTTKNETLKRLELYPIGIALGTYIIAENEEGIYLIDQHAAQERINYERILKSIVTKSQEIMLVPINIELTKSEYEIVLENMKYLEERGFMLSTFGINTFRVTAHPTWVKKGKEVETIKAVIDEIIEENGCFDPIKFNDNVAATIACKASIKGNMRITLDEANFILKELMLCDNPYNCPHGRPTIIKFTIYEIEKMFKRVM